MQLPQRLHELPDAQTLVVCKVGSRSAQATAYLVQHGYDAVNLDGGLMDWESAGRALVSDVTDSPMVV
jgi:rhodanese-related sulfurtransferase